MYNMGVKVAAVYLVLMICTFQDVEVKSMRVSRQVTSDFQSQVTNSVNASDNSLAENVGQEIDGTIFNLQLCPTCSGQSKS
uniref:Marking-associated unsecreted protein n=1 Tax=Papilio xuthus TaxID=66420 RepID=I4DLS4_PAPXU|nr:marking-associated unsecreted protein [Papilio xuthus]